MLVSFFFLETRNFLFNAQIHLCLSGSQLHQLLCLFRFKAVASKSKQDLVKEGFTEFTIEDFHNTVSFHVVFCS